jgi:hypothetical protein
VSVKQVVLSKEDFPPLSPDGEYLLKYRIVSEDKNRSSHWSPIYKLDVTNVWDPERSEFVNLIEPVAADVSITGSSNTVSVTWEKSNLQQKYDIFVSFGVYNVSTSIIAWTDYSYLGSSSTEAYSFLRKAEHTDVRVQIQLAGINKEINSRLDIATIEKTRRV